MKMQYYYLDKKLQDVSIAVVVHAGDEGTADIPEYGDVIAPVTVAINAHCACDPCNVNT